MILDAVEEAVMGDGFSFIDVRGVSRVKGWVDLDLSLMTWSSWQGWHNYRGWKVSAASNLAKFKAPEEAKASRSTGALQGLKMEEGAAAWPGAKAQRVTAWLSSCAATVSKLKLC